MAKVPVDGRPRPRKAPRQARSLETVKAIVEAAARILEEGGHAGLSTNAVAERAGVSIGSLYQYFPNKDALIGALIARETALLIEDARRALDEPSGQRGIALLIDACIAHQFRRPELARLLDFEEARLPLDAGTLEVKERFALIMAEVLGRADLPPQEDVALATRDVVAIVKGMVDAAGLDRETGARGLARRVGKAVSGYLGYRCAPPGPLGDDFGLPGSG